MYSTNARFAMATHSPPVSPIIYGRQHLLNEVVQGVQARLPQSFALVGARFTGKSALLRHLATESMPLASQPANQVIAVWVDGRSAETTSDPWQWLAQGVASQLRYGWDSDHPQEIIDWNTVDAQSAGRERLVVLIQQLRARNQRLLLLLDNFDRWWNRARSVAGDGAEEHRAWLAWLTSEVALICTLPQPLLDLDSALAETLPATVVELYVGLLEESATRQWLATYQAESPALIHSADALLALSGRHPFLLAQLRGCLAEARQMLPAAASEATYLAWLRLRLAERARPLWLALWQSLQQPPAHIPRPTLMALLRRLVSGPLTAEAVTRPQQPALNWLINQACILYTGQQNSGYGYQLFSPLFADFLSEQLSPAAEQLSAPTAFSSPSTTIPVLFLTTPYEQLTKTENTLLRYLQARSRNAIPTEQLLAEVWKRPDASARRVQEAIRRLRHQLEQLDPPLGIIENDRGRGYRFVPAG